jgi:integrase
MKGSLKRKKNSKGVLVWQFQWRENGRGRTKWLGSVREMSRTAAQAAGDAIVKPLNAGKPQRATGVTVEAYVRDEYLATRDWKLSTEGTTTDIIERYILAPIGKRLLAEVTRVDLQRLLDGMVGRAGQSIIDRVRFQIRAIYNLAHADGHVVVNPAVADVLHTPRAAEKRVAPEIGDREAVAKAIMVLPVRERLFLALASWRGIRPGEIAALKIGDIRDGVIHVTRRVYRGVVDSPKTEKGTREIPVESLADLLNEHLATLPDASPAAWLFPSENGKTPISASNLYRRRLKPVLEAAGLKRFNFQAMRATFNTLYAESEPDALVRAVVMGHNVDVGEHVYRRTSKPQRSESIRKLDGKLQ